MAACPSLQVLEAFAAADGADEAVASHVSGCAACRGVVENARENNRFLAGVRRALEARAATATNEEPPPPEPGLVSGYEMLEEIHRGGQGVVYRAIQTRTGRTVAIKMLLGGRGATPRQRERFEREVRIAAGLRHPNIVTVHDSGYVSDGQYGLVMEYIQGIPLNRWSRSLDGPHGRDARRRALRDRLDVMLKVCDAVLCAHQHSIVHRDLKPANILVDSHGEPHILDFGVARDTGPQELARLTCTGEFAGTLAYASPEQVSGDLSKVDTRTDIYSLGVIMYELVSGRMPYAVDGPMSQILRSIESDEPAPLPRHTRDPEGPWADGEVSTIILKALAKDPARRYQTAAGLRNDISRYLSGEPIEARRDSTWYMLRKTAARHRVVVAAAALFFVLLTAFAAAMARQAHRLEVRGRELATALSASNVERGRSLAAAGNITLAEETVFPELIRAGVTRIDGPEAGCTGSPEALHAYWALWDVFRSSRCVATLRTLDSTPPLEGMNMDIPDNYVRLLYFDEGGQRLNALDSRGRLVSWSVATWEPVRDKRLFAIEEKLNFQAFLAPSGSIFLFGPKGMIRTVNPQSGQVEVLAQDPDTRSAGVALSPDGTLIAKAGQDKQLRVRDARSPATVLMTADGVGWNPDLPTQWAGPGFSPDGGQIAAAQPDGSLGLWNTKSGVLERSLHPPASLTDKLRSLGRTPFGKLAFAPDGTIASQYGLNLVVWPGDGSAPRDLGEPGGSIEAITFLPGPEGWMVVTCGAIPAGGGITTLWDLASGHRRATFNHPDGAGALAVSPDARLLVVGTASGMVQVYEAVSEPHVAPLQAGRSWPYSIMAISPDGKSIAITTGEDPPLEQDVVLVDIKSRATHNRFHRTGPEIVDLQFAPDGSSLFEFDKSGRIKQWDLRSDSCVREFAFPEPIATEGGDVNMMRVSPDGSILARAREDGDVGLWDVPSGLWIGNLDGATHGAAAIGFSPDGRTLVAQHLKAIVFWDVQTRHPKRTIAIDTWSSVSAVRFSPDGRTLTRNLTGRLQFCDAESGRVLSECTPGSAGMGGMFHPGGSVYFATAWDRSIHLWDTRTGRELLSLQKHAQFMRGLQLTPDGNTLISSDWAGTVLVWDLTYYNDRIRRELEFRAALPAAR